MLALPTSLDSPVQWYLSNHRIVSGFSINAEDLGQATMQDYNNVLFTALEAVSYTHLTLPTKA